MSQETANKLVVALALVGAASVVVGKQSFAAKYRRVWGLTLVTVGGAILADLAPSLVGPYLLLVLLALSVSRSPQLGNLLHQAESALQGKG